MVNLHSILAEIHIWPKEVFNIFLIEKVTKWPTDWTQCYVPSTVLQRISCLSFVKHLKIQPGPIPCLHKPWNINTSSGFKYWRGQRDLQKKTSSSLPQVVQVLVLPWTFHWFSFVWRRHSFGASVYVASQDGQSEGLGLIPLEGLLGW